MDEQNTDVIQGTLDMLILKTLSLEPLHGFGIARRIEQIRAEFSKSIQGLCSPRSSGWSGWAGSTPIGARPATRAARNTIR